MQPTAPTPRQRCSCARATEPPGHHLQADAAGGLADREEVDERAELHALRTVRDHDLFVLRRHARRSLGAGAEHELSRLRDIEVAVTRRIIELETLLRERAVREPAQPRRRNETESAGSPPLVDQPRRNG